MIKTIQQWISKIKNYDALVTTRETLEKEIAELQQQVKQLTERNSAISAELQNLKKKEPSVNDAQYWNNKWTKNDIYYNAPNSRKVIEYVRYREIPAISDIADILIRNNNFSFVLMDNVPLAVMKWLEEKFQKKEFRYADDKKETWNTPEQTLQDKAGDCDDFGLLEYFLIREIFKKIGIWNSVKHRLKCQALNVNNYSSIPSGAGGHFCLLWLHSEGEWFTVESTYYLEKAIAYYKRLSQKLNPAYGTIWFTFNEGFSWAQNSISVSAEDFKKINVR